MKTDSWNHPDPYVIEVEVKNTDLDSYGHVNNAVYMRWMDECARDHSKADGIDCDEAQDYGFGMAVRESRIRYLSAAFEGEKILIGNWIGYNDGRLRINRVFQIIRPDDNMTLLSANLDYVCINIKTGRASKMPDLFREVYATNLGKIEIF